MASLFHLQWTRFSWTIFCWGMLAWGCWSNAHASAELHSCGPGSDCAALRQSLAHQWRVDSTQVAAFADGFADCVTAQGNLAVSALAAAQVDTLLRIYQIGLAHDPANRPQWLLKRALLGIQRPAQFAAPLRSWILAAIGANPESAPRILYEQAQILLLQDYKAIRLALNVAAADWAMLDRWMLLRELAGGEEAIQWAADHQRCQLAMRSALPDCNQLNGNFAEQLSNGKLSEPACQTFLILYDLQGCDSPSLWELAIDKALAAGEVSWLRRLAGAEAFNRGDWAQSRLHWQRAMDLEADDRLKAMDALQIAQAWLAEKDFRQARGCILAANALHPGWGEPYIRLMDLYLEGIATCSLSQFDQKAVYWLLIDLCHELLGTDANYAAQANERLYAYRQLAPTKEEAAFLGFKPGDSCPLKCWMSTSTQVPLE